MIEISVIVCAHNSQMDYLGRVLEALRAQTLSCQQWELLVVDNRSDVPLKERMDLTWHPQGRCVREDALGLTAARLRGIIESRGEVLVFVDDDNVLDSDYLAQAREISVSHRQLGVWGGSIRGEFECPPPDWAQPHLPMLAIGEVNADRWSNERGASVCLPCGAGMCVRRPVAEAYRKAVLDDVDRGRLDRRGGELGSAGDTDIALTAFDVGLGTGVFRALRLTHLIPRERLREDYLLRLMEGLSYSHVILNARRGQPVPNAQIFRLRMLLRQIIWTLTLSRRARCFCLASQNGQWRALKALADQCPSSR
jgi:glycosyltransferase involved in cell wall biosynthesis